MKQLKLTSLWSLVVFMVLFNVAPPIVRAETKKRTCGPQPGQQLQHFLDELNPGDTLIVSGTCNENVVIGDGRHNITLDGQQGSATIHGPDPGEPTVNIRGRRITIRGFTITGGREGIHTVRGGSAIIDGNTIQNVRTSGIVVHNQSNAIIVNNTIQNNPEDGINVIGGSNAFIGIRSGHDTVASFNTIQNNGRSGVFVRRGSNARIVGNTISGNHRDGIVVSAVSHADISSNTIDDNGTASASPPTAGISVGENSGVNLGRDTGTGILDKPNNTTLAKANKDFGIRCFINSYANGRLNTGNGPLTPLAGTSAPTNGLSGGSCVNSLDQ